MKDPDDTATIEMFPGVTQIPENFKNHPQSVKEIRSDMTGRASDWSPRDVLIKLLRDIDNGEKIDCVVLCYASFEEDRRISPGYLASSPNPLVSAGLFEWGKKRAMGE